MNDNDKIYSALRIIVDEKTVVLFFCLQKTSSLNMSKTIYYCVSEQTRQCVNVLSAKFSTRLPLSFDILISKYLLEKSTCSKNS